MKIFIQLSLLVSLLFFNPNSFAGKIGLDLGAGFKSTYGILGGGVRYFPNKRFDIFYNAGADVVGSTSTIGARLYTNPLSDICLLFISCVPLYYIGFHIGESRGSTVTVESNNIKSEYDFTDSKFSGVNIGLLDLFGDWFYYSLDVGYRIYSEEPSYVRRLGPINIDTEESFDQYIKSGLSFSFNLGVLF